MGYQNFFATRLFTDIGASDTTITLETPPSVTEGRLVLEARNSSKREIISFTGVSGNDITGVTRGVGGTSATTHTQNSLVEMNVTAEDLEEALNVPDDIITRFDEVVSDHVASGLVVTDDTGLTADISAGVAYINGIRLSVSVVSNRAFTASKDTYVDLGDNGVLDYNEVSNGAAAPTLAASHIRLARVVTNATDTTSIYNYNAPAYLEKANGWNGGLPAVSSVTYNGQRSYDITFASSVASLVSVGQRLRITRTTAAPTQCADLEATSSQYFNDTSVSGMTFTDDFYASAWVKLESYPGSQYGIISRFNGTSGWQLDVDSSGRVRLIGFNAGAANFRYVWSVQSVPTGRWVHIAAQLDMSTWTATDTTNYIMIDGVNVPVTLQSNGTNPTALLQAGNLEVGSTNGASFFDGKIAQAAVFSTKIAQSTVRAFFITHSFSGGEGSLVCAYTLSNSLNDLSPNANHLTAQGGALATNADSPFTVDANGVPSGIYDYAIATKVNGTVLTVQVPEGCTIPTSGGVNNVEVSPHKAPFGFPVSKDRWVIGTYIVALQVVPVSGVYEYASGAISIVAPVGQWERSLNACVRGQASSNTYLALGVGISTATSGTPTETSYNPGQLVDYGASTTHSLESTTTSSEPISLSSKTTYYVCFLLQANGTPSAVSGFYSSSPRPFSTIIELIPSHL